MNIRKDREEFPILLSKADVIDFAVARLVALEQNIQLAVVLKPILDAPLDPSTPAPMRKNLEEGTREIKNLLRYADVMLPAMAEAIKALKELSREERVVVARAAREGAGIDFSRK